MHCFKVKNIYFYTLLISILLSFNGFSQNNGSYFTDTIINSIENTSIILNSTSLNNSITDVNQLSSANGINSVVLKQVGLYNVSDISQSRQTEQNITQFGNKNYYSFRDYYTSSPISLSVLQQGNANSLQIYGSNSLINGMKIVQKSNFKNIVIKNYK